MYFNRFLDSNVSFAQKLFVLISLISLVSTAPLSHSHVTIQDKGLTVTKAKHSDAGPIKVPSTGLVPFEVSNLTTDTGKKTIKATLKTATGTTECSISVPIGDIVGDTMYPCADGSSFLGYPRVGHVAVLGWVATVGDYAMANGHGDIELKCNSDGTVCDQVGVTKVEAANVLTWQDSSTLDSA